MAPFAAVRSIGFALALTLVSAHLARAQTTVDAFTALPQVVKSGTRVVVEDEAGQRTKGKITELSDTTLELMTPGASGRSVTFAADRVRRVMRVDSRLNGFLLGAAAGIVPGLILGNFFNQYCKNESPDYCPEAFVYSAGALGLIGGGIGFAIDGRIDGTRLVYSRPARPGMALKLRF